MPMASPHGLHVLERCSLEREGDSSKLCCVFCTMPCLNAQTSRAHGVLLCRMLVSSARPSCRVLQLELACGIEHSLLAGPPLLS